MIEAAVILIAEARVDQFKALAVEVRMRHPTARSEHIAHEATPEDHGEKLVFIPVLGHAAACQFGDGRLIADDAVERLTIGREHHAVRAVFPRLALEDAQRLHEV